MTSIPEVIAALENIIEDPTVPKNVRLKAEDIIKSLNEDNGDLRIKIDKSLALLEKISDDPNIPQFVRMQLFNISSLLETLEEA